jgi:preprotein translocase subunit SecA
MAGRGTDIKLGKGVVKCKECCIKSPEGCHGEKKICLTNPPCGLHIIGTERHEARRIDRQLMGRSARQGDPGSARFYLSLEDNLMRLFGSDRIAGAMDRFGVKDGEPIEHKLITRAIEGAQKRVERYNFDIRKHLLEYDDVMNKQREVIYSMRNDILDKKNMKETVEEIFERVADGMVNENMSSDNEDLDGLRNEVRDLFLTDFTPDLETINKNGELRDKLMDAVSYAYKKREEELGEETIRNLERQVMLQVIDRSWREHLYELDALKEGIGLRGYAQRDPLVEYKRESFALFEELLDNIDREITRYLFGLRFVKEEEKPAVPVMRAYKPGAASTIAPTPRGKPQAQEEPERVKVQTYRRHKKKIGRNDPCPCGSGKKFKNCCMGKGIYD